MFKTIFTRTLYSLRWQFLGWTLGVIAMVFLTMVLYPSFNQQGIENIVNSIPDSFKSLIGNVSDFKTVPGYIGQQIFGPNLYIITLIMSILIYLGISASEESDGRLQSMLSFPLSRSRVYIEKWLAATVVVAGITLSVFIGLWLSLAVIHETANFAHVWQSIAALSVLNVSFGTLVFSVAFFTGNKMLTTLIAATYTVAAFFVTTLSPAVDKLQSIDKFSLLHYYNNPQIMANGLDLKHLLLLFTVITLLLVIGWIGFLRRDVKTA